MTDATSRAGFYWLFHFFGKRETRFLPIIYYSAAPLGVVVIFFDIFLCARVFLFQSTKLSAMDSADFLEAKQLGYSDIQISQRTGVKENEVMFALPLV